MPLELTADSAPTPVFTLHPVQADETLISIAAHYGVTTEALLALSAQRRPE